MNITQYIWLAICWIFFGLTHSLLATGWVKQYASRVLKGAFKFYRLGYSVFAVLLILYTLYYNFSIPVFLLWQPPLAEIIVAYIIGVPGLLVMLICIRKYFFDLSGIDVFFPSDRSSTINLQTNGLNRFVRHPLYTGTLTFVLAVLLYQPVLSNFISATAIFLYTIIGAHFEERRLIKVFGNAYKDYAEKVPMLLPKFI